MLPPWRCRAFDLGRESEPTLHRCSGASADATRRRHGASPPFYGDDGRGDRDLAGAGVRGPRPRGYGLRCRRAQQRTALHPTIVPGGRSHDCGRPSAGRPVRLRYGRPVALSRLRALVQPARRVRDRRARGGSGSPPARVATTVLEALASSLPVETLIRARFRLALGSCGDRPLASRLPTDAGPARTELRAYQRPRGQ